MRRHHRQHGTSLIEALIALLVLSLGMVGIARLHTHLRGHADIARQRSEAVRLAQSELERVRAMPPAHVASAASSVGASSGVATNADYRVERQVGEHPAYRATSVEVAWADRSGSAQRIRLDSVIASVAQALPGALAVQHQMTPLRTIRGRSAFIPSIAKDLGDGRSALKPSPASALVIVFDNRTGQVTARCETIAAATTAGLTAETLGTCVAMDGRLLSGWVRFSLGEPPEGLAPRDAALPLDVVVTSSHGGSGTEAAAVCATDIQPRAVAYHCVMTPLLGRWSGRSDIVPRGWTIGTSAADRKVCRYSADQDGSGAIDSPAEHPAEYINVDRALMQQNFLVIRGDQACPVATRAPGVFGDASTVQHQP